MKTIKERADGAIYEPTDGHPLKACEVVAFARGYELGAIEQKDIDDAELLKLKSSWEKEAQINHNDEANYKQGYHDAIEKAFGILEDMTEGRLGKRFISEFKNKLKYGVLERH